MHRGNAGARNSTAFRLVHSERSAPVTQRPWAVRTPTPFPHGAAGNRREDQARISIQTPTSALARARLRAARVTGPCSNRAAGCQASQQDLLAHNTVVFFRRAMWHSPAPFSRDAARHATAAIIHERRMHRPPNCSQLGRSRRASEKDPQRAHNGCPAQSKAKTVEERKTRGPVDFECSTLKERTVASRERWQEGKKE